MCMGIHINITISKTEAALGIYDTLGKGKTGVGALDSRGESGWFTGGRGRGDAHGREILAVKTKKLWDTGYLVNMFGVFRTCFRWLCQGSLRKASFSIWISLWKRRSKKLPLSLRTLISVRSPVIHTVGGHRLRTPAPDPPHALGRGTLFYVMEHNAVIKNNLFQKERFRKWENALDIILKERIQVTQHDLALLKQNQLITCLYA